MPSLFDRRLSRLVRQVVERALFRRIVDFEIVEPVIHNLLVVEADFGELATADRHDLVNVAFHARVPIVDLGVVRIALRRSRNDEGPAQWGTMTMFRHEGPFVRGTMSDALRFEGERA